MTSFGSQILQCARMFRVPLAAILVLLVTGATSRAQSVPTLGDNPPLVLQRGQNIELTLRGQHLSKVSSSVIVNPRGLEASILRSAPATQPTTQSSEMGSPTDLRVSFTAASDAALGERELRLVSPTGVSAPLRVTISQYPHTAEAEPNNAPDIAQRVQLPSVLTGRMDAPGDLDCFRFAAHQDEAVVFDVHAARSGSRLDPIVTIHDASGRELSPSVEMHGGDPTLIFTPPSDGTYEMEIRDLEFRGGADYAYRIDAGPIPYVQALMPMSGQPGRMSKVEPIGVNLRGLDHLSLDLNYAALGPVDVRGRTENGLTNNAPFEISDLPAYVKQGHNHSANQAETVPCPVDISGRIEQAGEEDFFRFHVDQRQLLTIETVGRRIGSPIDCLLTLRNIKGDSIINSDDAPGRDARITRDLQPGDYLASLRDLTYHGGPDFIYRLRIRPGGSGSGQDFAVRFLPDAIRVSRGGTTAVFCDVQRLGGFKGDVTISLEDLPPGLTVPPIVLAANSSDVFTISADAEAVLGTFPIRVRATATIDNQIVTKLAEPLMGNRPVEQAYLTVMEAAPFTIESLQGLTPPRVQRLSAEADALAKKLNQPTPELEMAQAEWERKISTSLVWTSLDDAGMTAAGATQITRLADGSFLIGGELPAKETYSIVARTNLTSITAIRFEVLPDDSLPNKGPGRHPGDGNFVLSKFSATIASASEPDKFLPLALRSPKALLEQEGFPISETLKPKTDKGWAISPYAGRFNAAYFFTRAPSGYPQGSLLHFALDQQYDKQFAIGRLRLSVTTDPDAAAKVGIPQNIADLAATPGARRTPQQKAQLAEYYRMIDPKLSAIASRLAALQKAISASAELARLEAALNAPAPMLDAERSSWEKRTLAGDAWLPLDIANFKSAAGATFAKQPDGSLLVSGIDPATDSYTLAATAPISNITAIRIEALPDAHFPDNGPGRSAGGNFVLTKLAVSTSSKAAPAMASAVEFRGASASFSQQGFSPLGALDDRDDTGWAVAPAAGLPSVATFYPTQPIAAESGSLLTILLDQKYAAATNHTLGRFRIWVTSNPTPDSAANLPADVLASLKMPADKRDAAQKAKVMNYYKSAAAPSLAPLRTRAQELTAQIAEASTFVQYRAGEIPLLINRNDFAGDVQVTLEGYAANRKRALATSMKLDPLRMTGNAQAGALRFTVEPASETGTRMAVLKAEAKIGDETYVQYSPAFPITLAPAR
ncbi:MAG TPA: hypothetical protein VH370_14950 [Humisphaera sp.]|nr:hypothetical protein [Humisphaera sp.]